MRAQPLPAAHTTDIGVAVDFLKRRFGDIHTGYAVLGFIKDGITNHGYINLQSPDRWERARLIIERSSNLFRAGPRYVGALTVAVPWPANR